MSLLNEIVKLLSSPTWGGIGVLVSTLLAIIALTRTRKSSSKPDSSQQESLIPTPSVTTLSLSDQGTTTSPQIPAPRPKRRRKNRRKSNRQVGFYDDDDPTGGVPDAFLPPSYWN